MMATVSREWKMRCPECGDDNQIDIAATIYTRLCGDGTSVDEASIGDHEWTEDSIANCHTCGFEGTVKDYKIKKTPVCARCSSGDIALEAVLKWSDAEQKWAIGWESGDADCSHCDTKGPPRWANLPKKDTPPPRGAR